MPQTAHEIDAIVREVVRRLRAGENGGERQNTNGSAQSPRGSDELAAPGRVITLAQLEGRLVGLRRVVVKPEAVVTPAVEDELRDRNIELVRCNAAPEKNVGNGSLLVGATELNGGVAAADLVQQIGGADFLPGSPLEEIVPRLAERLGGGKGRGVLLTEEPHAAVCEANRHRSLRAAAAGDVNAIVDIGRQIDANLLVLDVRRLNAFQVRNLIREYMRQCSLSVAGG